MRLDDLILKSTETSISLDEIHLSTHNKEQVQQMLDEFNHFEALMQYDLPIANKVLLHGHTGCGKTATAKAIAQELHKEIIILNLGSFVSSKLGETARNITNIFKKVARQKAVLFLDEFDYIGKVRDYDSKDSGEMKRIVNTIIQLIDYIPNDTLLIAATNYVEIIDTALLRRFQVRLQYNLPTKEALDRYYDDILKKYPKQYQKLTRVYDISYAEAKDIVTHSIKKQIITAEKNKASEKKHYLFSYGTLQLEKVQQETYNRILSGSKDSLTNYKLESLEITNTEVLAKSEQKFHPIAVKTLNSEDHIEGVIFEITEQELLDTDTYEVEEYKRVLETFNSGKEAWVYVAKNT
ncbi:AAA family ATPase [uncultured Kordia sp.]|uniref:AAA family ATPase n=1 Tax=uncultured Kordia sp. TaxID=507699 RepID=UPI00345C2A4D